MNSPTLILPSKAGDAPVEGGPFARQHPLKIIIAEDNLINQKVLLALLKRLGYEADCVGNGLECWKAVMKGNYDLMLTDIDMPEMDGIECTKRLRAAGVRIPIIGVTASSLHPREVCLEAGMDGYLAKPLSQGELLEALRMASERKYGR